MQLPSTALVAAVGAIVAAFITGAISFVNIVISKDQKISEFRQKWIDDLRDDLSTLLALIDTMSELFKQKTKIHISNKLTKEEFSKFYNSIHPKLKEMNSLYNRVQLRLNPNEHKTLLSLLSNIESVFNNIETERGEEDFTYLEQMSKKALVESQKVLKIEWRRVKRGEINFLLTKYCVLIAFITVILIFVFSFFDIIPFDLIFPPEKT